MGETGGFVKHKIPVVEIRLWGVLIGVLLTHHYTLQSGKACGQVMPVRKSTLTFYASFKGVL